MSASCGLLDFFLILDLQPVCDLMWLRIAMHPTQKKIIHLKHDEFDFFLLSFVTQLLSLGENFAGGVTVLKCPSIGPERITAFAVQHTVLMSPTILCADLPRGHGCPTSGGFGSIAGRG